MHAVCALSLPAFRRGEEVSLGKRRTHMRRRQLPVRRVLNFLERWQSGRMRRTRNPVYGSPVSRVRIPPSPPDTQKAPDGALFAYLAERQGCTGSTFLDALGNAVTDFLVDVSPVFDGACQHLFRDTVLEVPDDVADQALAAGGRLFYKLSGLQPPAGAENPPYAGQAQPQEHQCRHHADADIDVGQSVEAPAKTRYQIHHR